MSDQPSTILREAKGTHASIKELLKTREPFDREIDFQRKSLRRRYLSLLLVHPYVKESENAETHLWMQTSYIFISEYKQRLTRIDRAIQRSQQGQQSNSHSHHGPVENRKLLHRFRQFLAEEDKFWTQFIIRYYRTFELTEAHDALVTLGILSETVDSADEIAPSNGRNHFQFPTATFCPPTTTAHRQSRLTILSKALVCLGDIARYREQYNEAGGRSRAGPDDGGRKRNKRGGSITDIPRPKNFEKARRCYEQAQFLTPHDGNPSHQLAIIASYERNSFSSLVHYYRSLCVRHPYETASENMVGLLNKALEQRNTAGISDIPSDIAHVPKVQIEELKRKVVFLHALWWLGDESDYPLMVKEAANIHKKFYELVYDRHLPEALIMQLIILAQGALWRIHMYQDSSIKSNNNKLKLRSGSSFSAVVEARMFTHLLNLYCALFEVGIHKLKEPPPVVESDLASRLIVEFRRTLPAMRIAGKWLLANYKYVMSDPEAQGVSEDRGQARDVSPGFISPSSVETITFWRQYVDFLRALSRAFPMDRLPQLSFPLAEDVESKGFRPLKDYAELRRDLDESNADIPRKESEVHPNDVQLMRIEDILRHAKALVELENSPIAIYGNHFVLRGVESQIQPIPSEPSLGLNTHDGEDDAMTELTSDTDIIRDAFHHWDEDDEDDEDEIVYPKSSDAPLEPSPVLNNLVANVHLNHSNPIISSVSPIALPHFPEKLSTSPVRLSAPSHLTSPSANHDKPQLADKITAEDLLKGFMGPGRVSAARTTSDTSVTHSPFSFDRSATNIWSASQDEQPLRYPTGGPQMIRPSTPRTRQYNLPASQDISSQQSVWMHAGIKNFQKNLSTLPSSVLANRPTYPAVADPGHQRALSTSSNTYLYPPSLPQNYSFGQREFISPMLPTSYLHTEPPAVDTAQNSYSHTRHLSLHDAAAYSSPAMPPASSIWGSNG